MVGGLPLCVLNFFVLIFPANVTIAAANMPPILEEDPMSSQDNFYSCGAPSSQPVNADADSDVDPDPDANSNYDASKSAENSSAASCVGTGSEEFLGIKIPPLTFPKSQFSQWEPPLPVSDERIAVSALRPATASNKDRYDGLDFVSIDLDEFTIYRTADVTRSDEMVSLSEVASKQGTTTYLFDGILKKGSEKRYLQRVPFTLVSTGGYEDVEQHSVGLDLWIQSIEGRKRSGIWYRLLKPSKEYSRFHESFLWLADLAKHLIDYFSEQNHKQVTLNHIKRDFHIWLGQRHGGDPAFVGWISNYGSSDFRQAVVAHGDYLHKQAVDINARYGNHPIWKEIGITNPIVKEHPQNETHTVVTPYVYECFQHMDWAHYLKPMNLNSEVASKHRQRLEHIGFVKKKTSHNLKFPASGLRSAPILEDRSNVACGEVIAVKRDLETVWKGHHDDLWYALVQSINQKGRKTLLDVIWLYKPSDTVCANMEYPFQNELFMSDHCNCDDAKIEVTEVVEKINVSFFSDPIRDSPTREHKNFFIRQSYHSEDETFATLKKPDFCCDCRRKVPEHDYKIGDTVLVESITDNDMRLEPVEITKIGERRQEIEVRELLRRGRDFKDSRCRPNELVYTDSFREIHVDQIHRRCHVRLYTQDDVENRSILAPYNRDGNGDAFYITSREKMGKLEPLNPALFNPALLGFKQGFDPSREAPKSKLRALNIFSGGGSFDRGLEEGTAIQNEWAVEWGMMPMLTYRANHQHPDKMKLFCGSVNDYLSLAIRGKGAKDGVAQIGRPDFLSAGSPCQGYSLANGKKASEGSLRNCSMIASVMAFVDLYRFKYGLLENVPAMASKTIKKNPLSQILCCLVGMGYQVRVLNLDAWSFGAPQSRSRLFVSFAAPGLQLPAHPSLTHSHPDSVRNRSLGEAANGLPFGNRRWDVPIFNYITAAQATKDLPDASKTMCISKPDHRTSRTENQLTQNRINQVPKAPYIQGLTESAKRGWLNQADIEYKNLLKKGSRAWSRIHPHRLIPTVTTAVVPACRFTGRWLHWEDHRLLTVMEARRAQGYPDDEVLIGRAPHQWKIVGNSVARQVALALGLSLREACLANERRESEGGVEQLVDDIMSEEAEIEADAKAEENRKLDSLSDTDDLVDEISVASFFAQFERRAKRKTSLDALNNKSTEENHQVMVTIRGRYRSSTPASKSTAATTVTAPSSRDNISTASKPKRQYGPGPVAISDSESDSSIQVRKRRRRFPQTVNNNSNIEDSIMLD